MVKVFWMICLFFSIANAHKLKSDPNFEDLLTFFRVEKREDLPDYQLVKIKTENFAGGKLMSMQLVGAKKLFKLKKVPEEIHADVPVYEVIENALHPNGYSFEKLPQDLTPGHAYQDEDNHAAFVIHPDEDGKLSVEGTIGDDHVLQPVPPHLSIGFLTENARKKRSDGDSESRPNDEVFLDKIGQDIQDDENIATGEKIFGGPDVYNQHIIYKRPLQGQDNHTSDYVFMEVDDDDEHRRRRSVRNKRQLPSTIYVDTLVYVDHMTYKKYGNDEKKIRKYQSSFWNAVDLRFRALKSPKVRINLVGVVVAKNGQGAPFVANNMKGTKMLVADNALDDMGKYLYQMKDDIKTKFDIAILVTSIDICSLDSARMCGRSTTGLAYVAGACVVNRRSQKVINAGLVEDSMGYSGVMTAAHEVGHLLGAVHDGEPAPRYEDLPGAERCSFQEGYIMSYLHTKNSFKWSPCSINIFQKFLRGEGSSCLYNAPRKIRKLATPGKWMSLDDQCRMDRGTKACFKDYRACTQLFCYNQGSSGPCTSYRPAVDGSTCGKGLYCLDGKCIRRK